MTRFGWMLRRLGRQLWLRATLIGLLGVWAALLAAWVQQVIREPLPDVISASVLGSILNILATSMLTVTTFSLSVMVSAYATATSTVTPRATTLLIQDRVTQRALSTFLGSFLFAMVGIVVLGTGTYTTNGRAVLFAFTVIVIILIVIAMLQWIEHLTWLGRVAETTTRVEEAAMDALEERMRRPCLGAVPMPNPAATIPADATSVVTRSVGYVQFIDVNELNDIARAASINVYVLALPGTFAFEGRSLMKFVRNPQHTDAEHAEVVRRLAGVMVVEDLRSYDQDPRFGLAVLAEVAARALSPAVNDSGTAIDVIGRAARVLSAWGTRERDLTGERVRFPRIHIPPLADQDLFEDVFGPIARDGAGRLEVALRLIKALRALRAIGYSEFQAAAEQFGRLTLDFADNKLERPEDRERLRRTWESDAEDMG